jgi:polysaccharide export outer membrane protein
MRHYVRAFAFGLVLTVLSGCAMFSGDDRIVAPELTYKKLPYVIGVSDQLRIDVWRNQDLSRPVLVRPDGFITMPLMGDVKAEGKTPEELAGIIADALRSVIKNPEVSVTVDNPVSVDYQFRVRAMGQVGQPVSIAFFEGMTVMDLVLAAGGVSPYGAANRAVLNRLTDEGYKEYPVKLSDILENGDIRTNYLLQPSDIITIPEKRIWRGEF